MNNLSLFGKRIRELRKSRKITQEQLAEIVGLDAKQIGNIENGAGFTTMMTLEKFAKYFEIEIYELFTFAHQKPKEQLIKNLISLIRNANENDLKIITKVVNSLLN